jgi:L-ascorbate metabolism protein UlaG (beta-lactamase superfamily)
MGMKRKIKMVLGIIVLIVILGVVSTAIFLNLSPQFGASKSEIRSEAVLSSPNFKDGSFLNISPTKVMLDFKLSSMAEFFRTGDKVPDVPIPVEKIRPDALNNFGDSLTRITWFGHSTLLIETMGKTILVDPMLGNVPSPVSWAGTKRFNPDLPVRVEDLPQIDVVLISHDHYDHLDYGSIINLKDKVSVFLTPLGVGAHLRSWGVDAGKIKEIDWWQTAEFDGIEFVATPARHFSGRGIFDRNTTQWCSWVIQSDHDKIFFSGDGGYGEHFKEIGNRFGPFDFAFMECGQYDKQWPLVHMLPHEVPQALKDLKTNKFMPIHWGAFNLAMHRWTHPVDELQKHIKGSNLEMATPMIGESFFLSKPLPKKQWWLQKTIAGKEL